MSGPKGGQARLSRDDWIQAALKALGDGGLNALAVEPIARDLGVTKGSFYWHFADLDALVAAVLKRWAVEDTARAIAALEEIPDPRARLHRLMSPPETPRGSSRIDVALLASAGDARVSPWLRKHHRLWLGFAERTYCEMGMGRAQAKRWALLAYGSYLGLMQLLLSRSTSTVTTGERGAYLRFLRSQLIPPNG